jgi:hypothetical protein
MATNQGSTNQESLAQAQNFLTRVQADVFFKKLAVFGITPKDEQDAKALWQYGGAFIQAHPPKSELGQSIKQASCRILGNQDTVIPEQGFSKEALSIADSLLQIPDYVKAAQFVMAASQV